MSTKEIIINMSEKSDKKATIIDTSYTQWSHGGNGLFYPVGVTQPTLEPGVYTPTENQGQVYFVKQELRIDTLMELPHGLSSQILSEIEAFWKRGHLFKEYGFLHRRGMMLTGPTGSGKTSIIQQMLAKLMEAGGIAFLCYSPNALSHGLKIFRQIEPDRPVVCVFEDIDATIRNFGEEVFLKILDGESQIDKVLNIATTNYPEQLDKRLTSRPRRFDRIFKIGYPDETTRSFYFKNKLKIKDEELDKWVAGSKDFSFAAMSELVISVKCFDLDFDESVLTLQKMMKQRPSSTDEGKGTLGFGAN